jgi:uncharacterized membrane protein YgdD (TMEM256/DUF423 family)
MHRLWIALGALLGLGAVALAAAGAHLLPQRLDARALDLVRTAVQIEAWHALALLFCGLWAERRCGLLVHAAAAAFVAGTLLFCGAVGALALGAVASATTAPFGGTLLMLGWLLLAASALRRDRA